MPLFHDIQVTLPVRGQLGGICQLKGTTVLDCLKTKTKNPVHFFSYNQNSGLQGGTAPHPIPCLCPLTPQSGPLVHFSSTIGPSWRHHAEVLKRRHIPACLTKHRFPQASTTVVLDQIQMRSVSIFVKDYYAWFNEASCSCRRLLLLWTKVSSFYPPPLLFCSVVIS